MEFICADHKDYKKTIMHVKYESVQVVLEAIILILCNDTIIITLKLKEYFTA